MSQLSITENNIFQEHITVEKQYNTSIVLNTENTFVDKDIELICDVRSGVASVLPTSITSIPTISVSSNGVITAKHLTTQLVSPTITTPGWIDTGINGNITARGTATYTLTIGSLNASGGSVYALPGYYPITAVQAIAAGSVKTPDTSITVPITLNNTATSTGYVISTSKTQTISPVLTTEGYITNSDVQSGTITISGASTIPQSTLSATTITPKTNENQTVTIGAGYYHTARTVTINSMSAGTSAVINSEGSVSTAPSVTIGGTNTMAVSTSATPYYFTRTGTAAAGTVQTKYKVTTAGYTGTKAATNGGTVSVTPTKTADSTIYIQASTVSTGFSGGAVSCTNTGATNIELEDANTTNNGVNLTFKASRGQIIATTTRTAGYTAASTTTAAYAGADSNNITKYVKGVTLNAPSSGTATFYLTFPNGPEDMMTFHFEIDKNGNVTIY